MSGHVSSPSARAPRLRPEAEELLGREDPATAGLAPRDPLELAELLEGIDAHIRVRPDAERDPAGPNPLGWQEAIAEICFRRRAGTDRGSRGSEEIELGAVGMGRMNDRRSGTETAGARQELDRSQPVLGDAFLDLLRLLVCVHVQRKSVALGIASDLLQPVRRTRPDGVRSETDADASLSERLDLGQIGTDRLLSKAGETTACVCHVQHDELDSRGRRGFLGGERLGETEVVKLPDRGVACGPHLSVRALVRATDEVRRLQFRLGEHVLAPRPEVSSGRTAAQRSLEGVAVRVDETRQTQGLAHDGATLPGSRPPAPRSPTPRVRPRS